MPGSPVWSCQDGVNDDGGTGSWSHQPSTRPRRWANTIPVNQACICARSRPSGDEKCGISLRKVCSQGHLLICRHGFDVWGKKEIFTALGKGCAIREHSGVFFYVLDNWLHHFSYLLCLQWISAVPVCILGRRSRSVYFDLKQKRQMCVEAETWKAGLSGSDKRRNVIVVKEIGDNTRFLFWLKHSCT